MASLEMTSKDDIIRLNMEAFLPYICNCIQLTDILTQIHNYTKEQRKDLFNQFRQNNTEACRRALLLLVNEFHEPGRFVAFKEAMAKRGYPVIVKLLEGEYVPFNDNCQKVIELFTSTLVPNLNPEEILTYLVCQGTLEARDAEEVRAEAMNHGRQRACWVLLFHLPNRVENWFRNFMEALIEAKYGELAQSLEPDMYEKIMTQRKAVSNLNQTDGLHDDDIALNSDTEENTIEKEDFEVGEKYSMPLNESPASESIGQETKGDHCNSHVYTKGSNCDISLKLDDMTINMKQTEGKLAGDKQILQSLQCFKNIDDDLTEPKQLSSLPCDGPCDDDDLTRLKEIARREQSETPVETKISNKGKLIQYDRQFLLSLQHSPLSNNYWKDIQRFKEIIVPKTLPRKLDSSAKSRSPSKGENKQEPYVRSVDTISNRVENDDSTNVKSTNESLKTNIEPITELKKDNLNMETIDTRSDHDIMNGLYTVDEQSLAGKSQGQTSDQRFVSEGQCQTDDQISSEGQGQKGDQASAGKGQGQTNDQISVGEGQVGNQVFADEGQGQTGDQISAGEGQTGDCVSAGEGQSQTRDQIFASEGQVENQISTDKGQGQTEDKISTGEGQDQVSAESLNFDFLLNDDTPVNVETLRNDLDGPTETLYSRVGELENGLSGDAEVETLYNRVGELENGLSGDAEVKTLYSCVEAPENSLAGDAVVDAADVFVTPPSSLPDLVVREVQGAVGGVQGAVGGVQGPVREAQGPIGWVQGADGGKEEQLHFDELNDLGQPTIRRDTEDEYVKFNIPTDIDNNGGEDKDVELREYQKELAREGCAGDNVIVMAPTNTGKTRVAFKIIQEHLRKQRREQRIGRVIFLVENEQLALQQGESCAKTLPGYRTKIITGGLQRDKKQFLKDFVDRRDILIVTAQVLLNALKLKEIQSLTTFSMIVFDECHHTNNNHRFNEIMSLYMDLKLDENPDIESLPQIVGLTASVGVGGNVHEDFATKHMKEILANLDAKHLCTVRENKEELQRFENNPKENIVMARRRPRDPYRTAILEIMTDIDQYMINHPAIATIPKKDEFIKTVCRVPVGDGGSQQFQQWLSKFVEGIGKVRSADICGLLNPCREHLEVYNKALMIHADARRKDAETILETFMLYHMVIESKAETEVMLMALYDGLKQEDFSNEPENPKLLKLQEIVWHIHGNNDDARGIIFVKTRELADALTCWMNETQPLSSLHATEFVGQAAPAARGGTTKSQQKDDLEYFKGGRHKVIIATSVAEEGLDITKCNLVIRYEHVTNEIVRLQSRGRARAKDSRYYVLTEEGSWIVAKEEKNAMLERLMNRLIPRLQIYIEDHPNIWENEIRDIQIKKKLEELRKEEERQMKVTADQKELRCLNCDNFICFSTDLRTIQNNHHVAVVEDVMQRVISARSPHPLFVDEDLQFHGEVFCGNQTCQRTLGGICQYKHAEFPLFSIKHFRVVDKNGKSQRFKKWKLANFEPEAFTIDNLREVAERLRARNE